MNRQHKILVGRDEKIVTVRCRLRYPVESDIPQIWSASQTPNFNDGLRWEPPSGIAEIQEPLQRAQKSWESGNEYSWAIESKEDRDFIGWISIRKELSDREWSIGFWIHPTKQCRGFATECAASVLEFGLSRLGAKTITAAHATWNVASGHVLRRIGMKYVRTNPRGFKKNNKWVEEFEYEIRSD
jgi:RimJ/RimL family protein N-acetyltransferase